MNSITDLDDVPFVNEECGDTMWDETLLNQLTETTSEQQPTHDFSTLETIIQQTLKRDDSRNDIPSTN